MFKRGKAARERESLRRDQVYPNKSFIRTIRNCEIINVIGPEDGTKDPEAPREQYHLYVHVRTPTDAELIVPLAGTHHEIYTIYGTPKALIGKRCTVEYLGSSIKDAEQRGTARIERDMTARFPESRPVFSIMGLLGIGSGADHSKLGSESDFEGSKY